MRVFNALFATLTTLLLAATLVVSAGSFLGQRSEGPTEVARTEAPERLVLPATTTVTDAAPPERLVLQVPRSLGSPLATINPCLEPPSPLAKLR